MAQATVNDVSFTDEDIVNPDNWVPEGDYNPHNVRPWLLHDHGFVLGVAFTSALDEAIDELVDADKLDQFKVEEDELKDYPDEEGLSFLGNAGEPFDIETLQFIELKNPPASWVAVYNAMGA